MPDRRDSDRRDESNHEPRATNHRLCVSVVGGSGYAGGELIRLLLAHPHVEIAQVTSERNAGQPVGRVHPNLRKRSALAFCSADELKPCDVLFLCLPHGEAMRRIDEFLPLAGRIVDLSADFRLRDPAAYERWYGVTHPRPELLSKFVYGIPELHRAELRDARLITGAGCNATATVLALHPLFAAGVADRSRTVVEVKAGSSEGGASASAASHHPERQHSVRSYKPTAHRHIAEIVQELSNGQPVEVHFSATSIDLVRGLLATAHVFLTEDLDERAIWRIYRQAYADEPFIRIVKERDGHYRYPEPKLLWGTNGCDIGFERDPHSRRLVVLSAIDNLGKGAAGQAIQNVNRALGMHETAGLRLGGVLV
jgi:N-acetyl-gamma-glutamyl-phosphate/LysW-gamma-L-alpha-aminoadipyl-6-phosphate reductase